MTVGLATSNLGNNEEINMVGRIPVRNLWLLMLYASYLYKDKGVDKKSLEKNPDDIPDLVAEILSRHVERRIKRNLSFGYQTRAEVLRRIRGRINLLTTERHQLLNRGKVDCRFDELTINTPRNRFVRSALEVIAKIIHSETLVHRCRSLATSLKQMGVTGEKPDRNQISIERYGRHDAGDQKMVVAAQLAFNLALPTESIGNKYLSLPDREITWIRKLYEKGIAGFFDTVLSDKGWRVESGKTIGWIIDSKTEGIDKIFPSMRTDIVLENALIRKRIIIDTKFNSIVTRGWYREETIRSAYIYQMYTYLRSQEGNGNSLSENASGILLHPSVGDMINESVVIQGHEIRFATVDLGAESNEIRKQLLHIIDIE